ncbi:MAG: hypothetical protein JRN51_08915 [Nitrososphaerota archaeon]|nr:hypothetical protein [Nitrososphaerota archaeon]
MSEQAKKYDTLSVDELVEVTAKHAQAGHATPVSLFWTGDKDEADRLISESEAAWNEEENELAKAAMKFSHEERIAARQRFEKKRAEEERLEQKRKARELIHEKIAMPMGPGEEAQENEKRLDKYIASRAALVASQHKATTTSSKKEIVLSIDDIANYDKELSQYLVVNTERARALVKKCLLKGYMLEDFVIRIVGLPYLYFLDSIKFNAVCEDCRSYSKKPSSKLHIEVWKVGEKLAFIRLADEDDMGHSFAPSQVFKPGIMVREDLIEYLASLDGHLVPRVLKVVGEYFTDAPRPINIAAGTANYYPDAQAWLQDQALIARIEDAIVAPKSKKPLLGENDNALQLLLTLLAKGSVEVRGQTAAGKNTLAEAVLSVFPRTDWVKVGGLTDKSLRYLDENVKILYVTERRGMESGVRGEETTSEYDAKLGISEGEITVAVTEKDTETGQLHTSFRRVSIESFIWTTTEIAAPPELENRISAVYVRDDTEQNALVRDKQLELATRLPWELVDQAPARATAASCLELVRKEAPQAVIVPYSSALRQILLKENSIVRRNTPKILNLIKACTRLYYKQRQTIEGPNGEKVLVADLLDLALVLSITHRSMASTLSAVPEKAGVVLGIIRAIQPEAEITIENVRLNVGDKAPRIGNMKNIRAAFGVLKELGLIIETGERKGRGGAKIYALNPDTTSTLVIDVQKILSDASLAQDAWKATQTPQLDSQLPNFSELSQETSTTFLEVGKVPQDNETKKILELSNFAELSLPKPGNEKISDNISPGTPENKEKFEKLEKFEKCPVPGCPSGSVPKELLEDHLVAAHPAAVGITVEVGCPILGCSIRVPHSQLRVHLAFHQGCKEVLPA